MQIRVAMLKLCSVLLMGLCYVLVGFAADTTPFLASTVALFHSKDGHIGTGVVIRPGLVLTNHHVFKASKAGFYSYQNVSVMDSKGRTFAATNLYLPAGEEPDWTGWKDFAVLAIANSDIPAAARVAYQNDESTILAGYDPAKKDFVVNESNQSKAYGPMIAHCNETKFGFSGGPVFNIRGELIGIHKGSIVLAELKCDLAAAPAFSISITHILNTIGTTIPFAPALENPAPI